MKNWFKKITIPSGETTEVEAYKSWTVRWNSIHGSTYSNGHISFSHLPVAEIFTSEEGAQKFADEIKAAFKLVRVTGGVDKVTVIANQ